MPVETYIAEREGRQWYVVADVGPTEGLDETAAYIACADPVEVLQ